MTLIIISRYNMDNNLRKVVAAFLQDEKSEDNVINYSDSFQFCYVAAWLFKLLFFLIILHSVPHNDKVRTEFYKC